MAMPKTNSIGIASESTPIQRPHLCTFVTFIVSTVSMASQLTFLYIVPALRLSALTMLPKEKQNSPAIFCTKGFVEYFIFTTDHQSPQMIDNGIGSR